MGGRIDAFCVPACDTTTRLSDGASNLGCKVESFVRAVPRSDYCDGWLIQKIEIADDLKR